MADFFGYERKVRPNGTIATSELATIRIGGKKISLVQSVTASYQQQVQTRFEAGSPTLYFVTGQPQGSINIGRLVGNEGFLAEFKDAAGQCGSLTNVVIALDGDGCAKISGGSQVKFNDAVVASVSLSFSASGLEVSESMTMQCAFLSQ